MKDVMGFIWNKPVNQKRSLVNKRITSSMLGYINF